VPCALRPELCALSSVPCAPCSLPLASFIPLVIHPLRMYFRFLSDVPATFGIFFIFFFGGGKLFLLFLTVGISESLKSGWVKVF
jgi:hypothetical protein